MKRTSVMMLTGFTFFLSLTSHSFAEIKGIDLNVQGPIMVKTTDRVTRNEERTETYSSTCTRSVMTGVETNCSPEVPTFCVNTPVYTDETFSCEETRIVNEQVYDHTVHSTIEIVKGDSARAFDLSGCTLDIYVPQDSSENYFADCDGALIRTKVLERTVDESAELREKHVKVQLDFSSIEGMSALKKGLTEVVYKNGKLSFQANDLSKASNFVLSLKITRNRFLLKDKVEFNHAVAVKDLSVQKLENGLAKMTIDLDKIGAGFDSSKKHTVELTIKTVNPVDVNNVINNGIYNNSVTDSVIVNE